METKEGIRHSQSLHIHKSQKHSKADAEKKAKAVAESNDTPEQIIAKVLHNMGE